MKQGRQTVQRRRNWEEANLRIGDSMTTSSDREATLLQRVFSDPTPGSFGEKVLSPEKVQAILKERAQALTWVDEVASDEMMQLVVFCLADETYGVATRHVREVQPLRDVSPVPCTPSFVVGVINIRGTIYSVIDIREFLGVPGQELTDSTKVLLVNVAGLEVGILADDVLGEVSLPLAEIEPPLATRGSIKEEYVRGVTKDMLSVLNLEVLMSDEWIIVYEEPG